MKREPLDQEWEKESMVSADAVSATDPVRPVETLEDFKQRLARLTPQELTCLWAKIKSGDPANGST